MNNYTKDQIGPIDVQTINNKTRGRYSIVLVQPGTNQQITVLEPADWDNAKKRVEEMVLADIDPADIRFVFRMEGTNTEGLPLRHVNEGLFWTRADQFHLEKDAIR